MRTLVSFIFVATTLAACAQTQTQQKDEDPLNSFLNDKALEVSAPTERIVNFRIDSWKYIDPHHVLIKTTNRDQYLVSLMTDCRELGSIEVIGTTSTSGALTKFDKIIYKNGVLGRRDCQIDNIVKLEPIDKDKSK